MSVRTAVVLAAGEGTRLRPLTRNRPKPMLPAANRPILEYVFDALIDAGISRIVAVVGYKRDRVKDHFGPTYRDVPVSYVTQEKQLGSGHALLQARSVVDGPVLVVNGDRLIDGATVASVVDHFEEDQDTPALAVIERADAQRYGAVDLRDGDLVSIVEKPDSNQYRLINGGIYAFPETIFGAIDETPRSDGELALTDTIARLIERGRVRAIMTDGMWVDATYPWDLLAVAREVLARGRVVEDEQSDGVWVDESATIHQDATLQAPVVVGPDCEVGPNAVVGANTALGGNVTVGAKRDDTELGARRGRACRRGIDYHRRRRRPGHHARREHHHSWWSRGRPGRHRCLRGPASASAPSSPTACGRGVTSRCRRARSSAPRRRSTSGVHAYGHVGEGVEVVR